MLSQHAESPNSAPIDLASGTPADGAATNPKTENGLYCSGLVEMLVVDDDPAVNKVICMALERDNFHIDPIIDPTHLQARLREKTYHIIILDYVLPGVSSEQVLTWVREYQPSASIIVVTGYPSMDSALNCLRAGTFDYITKPFQIHQLQKVVTRCLENKGLLRMTEEALRESLGTTIRDRRKAMGLTLAQMAQRTNVSLGYLSQIELGKNSASIETLYRISLGLGVKIADLFHSVQG